MSAIDVSISFSRETNYDKRPLKCCHMYTCPTFVDCLEIHIVVVYSVTSVDSGVAYCYREGEGSGERAWSNPSLFIDSPDRLD